MPDFDDRAQSRDQILTERSKAVFHRGWHRGLNGALNNAAGFELAQTLR